MDEDDVGTEEDFESGPVNRLARRQSESLAVEIGLLSRFRFIGIVPVP